MSPHFIIGQRVRLTLPAANLDATIVRMVCQSPCCYTLDLGDGELLVVREDDLAPAEEEGPSQVF